MYALNTDPYDTNTLDLSQRGECWLAPVPVSFQDRYGWHKTLQLVSNGEILAAMLQHGREFVFSDAHCSVDRLREHIAIRWNIVYWGSRAEWVYPPDQTARYNVFGPWVEVKGVGWTVRPHASASWAIADAFVSEFPYQMGCSAACRLIVAQGIFDYYRNERRDLGMLKLIEDSLEPGRPFDQMTPTVEGRTTVRVPGRLVDRQFDVPWNHWVPGDWGWIKNTDARSASELGDEGTNLIYAGGGKFVNYYTDHPPESLDDALKRVFDWRFAANEAKQELSTVEKSRLRRDPRYQGLLRDVRDVPKLFIRSPTSNQMAPAR